MKSRKAVVELAKSWLGKNEADGSFKVIIDIYNSFTGKLPRGTRMQYSWAWCACTWSALAIKLGYTDIMPIEISCYYLVEKAKSMGIWQEADGYVPMLGDGIIYDWDDNGKGDNKGVPDHIGVVEKVVNGKITVIEGNCSNAVKRRELPVNGKYIRGFITPKYDVEQEPVPVAPQKPAQPAAEKKVLKTIRAKAYASYKDAMVAGTYTTTEDLWMRDGAGTDKQKLVLLPKGTKCECYGYYNLAKGQRWLFIAAIVNQVEYIGFSSNKYLDR